MAIVAVSASVLAHQRQRYTDVGFDYVLGKPVERGPVIACLKEVLGAAFEVAESDQPDAVDLAPVEVSQDLGRRLREAAEFYHITDLIEAIDEVEQLGAEGRAWAGRLRERVDVYDMEGVLAILQLMGVGE